MTNDVCMVLILGLETEGLFRRSATASVLKHVQQQLNNGTCVDMLL